MKKIALFIIFMLISLNLYAATYTINFAWDRNTEPDLAGYKLYSTTVSGNYSDPNSMLATISDPNADTYRLLNFYAEEKTYFSLTALDSSYNESGFSNEVFIEPDNIPPNIPVNFQINIIINIPN